MVESKRSGFDPHSGRCVVSLSKMHLPPITVLLIPRKRWLHTNMTEFFLIGTLSLNPNKQTKLKFLKLMEHRNIPHTNLPYFTVNERIGFGAIDLEAMKHAAKKWKYVPEKHICVVDRKDGIGGYMSLVLRKLVFGVSDQVKHKPACSATESCSLRNRNQRQNAISAVNNKGDQTKPVLS